MTQLAGLPDCLSKKNSTAKALAFMSFSTVRRQADFIRPSALSPA
jgi:hypothetical protein